MSVRRRVTALVAVLLVAVLAFGAVIVGGRLVRAERAGDVSHAMLVANQVGGVLQSLESEELASVGFLEGTQTAVDLDSASSQVDDRVADVKNALGSGMPARVQAAIDSAAALDAVRQSITAGRETPAAAVAAFSAAIEAIIDSLSLPQFADPSTTAGRQVLALDTMLRIDARHAASAADLLVATVQLSEASVVDYAAAAQAAQGLEAQFATYASASQRDLYRIVTTAYVERVGPSFVTAFASAPRSTVATLSPTDLYPQLVSYVQLGRLVEAKIAADVRSAVASQQRGDLIVAYVVAGVTALIVLLMALAAWLVIRSVSRTLGGLALAESDAADHTVTQLRRVADDETEAADHVPIQALPVTAPTEAGDLARVFVRTQRTATSVVERQAAARRNLVQMTGNATRRAANLVARQVSIIDRLERAETDPATRTVLRRLDHVTHRLRRATASLITLSDSAANGRHAADESGYVTPMALADLIQLAADEIESESRVDVFVPASTMVQPVVIDDAVLLFAELIANATAYSPPASRVRVLARPYDHSVSIVDEGIGMSDEQLATVNARLAEPERLDLASTGALGLFLVGRIARRYDFVVTFEHTPGAGTTVIVDLGRHVGTVTPADTARATAPVVADADIPRPRGVGANLVGVAVGRAAAPVPALDSRPFNIEHFEHASAVLGRGETWNAFEVLPPAQPALPPGPTSSASTSSASASATVTSDDAGANGPATGDSGELPYADVDLPRAGTGYAAGGGPFGPPDPGAELLRPKGRFAGSLREFGRGGARPAEPPAPPADVTADDVTSGNDTGGDDMAGDDLAGEDMAGGDMAGEGPFSESAVFPAGGVARYVRRPDAEGNDVAPEAGSAPVASAEAAPVESDSNAVDAPSVQESPAATDNQAPSGAPPGGIATSGLLRRVPGATAPAEHQIDVPAFRTLDPDEARGLVEEFERGVTRALDEAAGDRIDDEGRIR
ncbi:MAG TPA: ATP-binding protein [Micromonosporaceae bacterium]|nr:ATP-binding protein [Micromonosporaceae bacterium]